MFEFTFKKPGPFSLRKESFDPHVTSTWPENAKIRDKTNPNFNSALKLEKGVVYLIGYCLKYDLKDFLKIVDDPTSTCIDLVTASENCRLATYDDYDAEKFATDNYLKCFSICLRKHHGEILYIAVKPYQSNYVPYNMNWV